MKVALLLISIALLVGLSACSQQAYPGRGTVPPALPLYPDAQQLATSDSSPSTYVLRQKVSFETQDSLETVQKFYMKQLARAGWSPPSSAQSDHLYFDWDGGASNLRYTLDVIITQNDQGLTVVHLDLNTQFPE